MPTLLVTKQDVLRVLNKRDAALAGLSIPGVTTVIGNTTTLNDTRLGFGTSQANKYDGRHIEIVEQVDSPSTGPTEGLAAGVDDAGFDLVDGLTISPAVDQSINTGTNYLIYGLGLSKYMLEEAANEVLRETQAPHLFRPSLIADAALDNAAVTTVWTEVGSLSTSMEYSATSPNTLLGEQSIHGVADAADEGWASDDIPVTDTETILLSVFVKALVGEVTVQLYNVTAAASIKEVIIDEPTWTEVRFEQAIPAACENVALRILSNGASDDMLMSAHPVIQVVGSGRPYPMPSWLESEAQIMGWIKFPRGAASEDADSYIALGKMTDWNPDVSILRDARAQHPFYLELEPVVSVDPVGLIAQREFDEVTLGVTATTNATELKADRAYMRSAIVGKILRDLGDPAAASWARAARVRAEQIGYGSRDLIIEPTPARAM